MPTLIHRALHAGGGQGIVRCAQQLLSVELSRSGRFIEITPEKSLLDTLLDAGVDVDHSCWVKVCGPARPARWKVRPTTAISVRSAPKGARRQMVGDLVCVSGCKSERLVLDI